jgi:hypothetical protein
VSGRSDLRRGRHQLAAPVAAAGECVLVTGFAWVAWQMIQGDAPTLSGSQFTTWLAMVVVGAIAVTVLGAVFWRSVNVRVALAGGLALSVVLLLLGLINDILTSAS